jgi:hypothetical protein
MSWVGNTASADSCSYHVDIFAIYRKVLTKFYVLVRKLMLYFLKSVYTPKPEALTRRIIRTPPCCWLKNKTRSITSVADPGCLSRILILPIPDPGSKNSNKREGSKKICYHTFFCSHKFHKIEKFLPNNFHYAPKCMGLGSEIRDPEKTYSGSRIQGSKRHRIPDPQQNLLKINRKLQRA